MEEETERRLSVEQFVVLFSTQYETINFHILLVLLSHFHFCQSQLVATTLQQYQQQQQQQQH